MAKLDFRADLKLATETLEAIERAVVASADTEMRQHLGASIIGRECDRELWYTFRWARQPAHEPRVLRLFARGQREEDVMASLLRKAGIDIVQIDQNTGQQFRFAQIGGHFGGSMDGACVNLPDAPKTWHVVEMKTHNAKSFDALAKSGVEKSKPEHWVQMQMYMAWTGMERALYMAVCKDDDRLHLERIDADKDAALKYMERAQRIITAQTPPDGISTDPTWYKCKFCDYHALCHGTEVPLPTCRSCAHATPELDGAARWSCSRHHTDIDTKMQREGCGAHRYIPILLQTFAESVDASEADNWIQYRNKKTGYTFVNGAMPEGYESEEIHACECKDALGDPTVQEFRETFSAKVTA